MEASNFSTIDASMFKALSDKYSNLKLIIDINDEKSLELVQKNEIPFFFSNYANSIDKVHGYMSYHPTDMYITEELGFSIDKVSTLLHNNNIKVRVFPNICQSNYPKTPSLKTFFIRPEDIHIYSNFVDVFELMVSENRQKNIFEIYKNEKWFGEINEIIPSFKGKFDSKFVLPNFPIVRTQCGKRCMYKPGSCAICDKYMDLAESFEKGQIGIIPKGHKVEN